MIRVKGATITAVVMTFAVVGCTAQQTEGSSGPGRTGGGGTALTAAESLTVKGRVQKTGYSRARFDTAWADSDSDTDSCHTRVICVVRWVTEVFAQFTQGVVSCA